MNCFKIKCGDELIMVPTEGAKFVHGYGILKIDVLSVLPDREEYVPAVVVVDDKFRQVLPVLDANKVEKIYVFPHNNVVVKCIIDDETSIMQYKFNNGKIEQAALINANDFGAIKELNNLGQLEIGMDGWAKYALYDVDNMEIISDYYNVIGTFTNHPLFDELVALASFYVTDEYGDVMDILVTYLNTKGEVVANFKSMYFNQDYSGLSLEEVIAKVKINIPRRVRKK